MNPDFSRQTPGIWRMALLKLLKQRGGLFGVITVTALIALALTAPLITNNIPIYIIKLKVNSPVAGDLICGKHYFPLFLTYKEFNFSTPGNRSKGRGYEQWMKPFKGSSKELRFFYQDENIRMIFPPFQKGPLSINPAERLKQPSPTHLMGTDNLGRDLFARILHGSRTSLAVGFIAQFFSLLIGIPMGLLGGYYGNRRGFRIGTLLFGVITLLVTLPLSFITGFRSAVGWGALLGFIGFLAVGWSAIAGRLFGIPPDSPAKRVMDSLCISIDDFIMWIINIISAFPFLLLVIAIVATIEKPDIRVVFVAIGVVSWVEVARIVRGQVLTIREKEFIEAARCQGATDFRIITLHILPNTMAPVIVTITLGIASAIMVEAGLSFLGLGLQPPHPTWGGMINDGRAYLEECPWIVIFPGFAIMGTIFAFNLLGDSLRDALDPKAVEPE